MKDKFLWLVLGDREPRTANLEALESGGFVFTALVLLGVIATAVAAWLGV